MRRNRLKAILESGGYSAGVIVGVADEQLVEVLALAGFGYIFIDCEHGHMSIREAESLVRASEAADIPAVVRVPTNEPSVILRHLDTGALGVTVPQMNTVEDAERAVEAAYYYPKGKRGLAGSRAASFGQAGSLADYTAEANEQLMVTGLIENVRAIDNLPDILKVDGLTAITIGPADLSQSLGHPGDRHHPEVQQAIDEIINQANAAGKPVGVNTSTGQDAKAARERGCQLTSVSAWGLLSGAAREYMALANG